jgi:hypothetical protein
MKQTAVEFLTEKVSEIIGRIPLTVEQEEALLEALEKAKDMEEEQHQETWFESTKQFDNSAEMTYKKEFKQYYTETFKPE